MAEPSPRPSDVLHAGNRHRWLASGPAPELRLWTVQRANVWDELQRQGVIHGDGRRVWRAFRPAYHWMMEQMRQRIPGYAGRFPIWAWYRPKPDLRRSAHLPTGTDGVRIEVRIPAAQALLSDFDAWHSVIAGYHVPLHKRERDLWDAKKCDASAWSDDIPADLRTLIVKSWDRIFDLREMSTPGGWHPRGDSFWVQGVLAELRLEQVVTVRRFVAR